MTTQKVIIDCDPGADDAIALLLALAHPQTLEVLAVTTVAGNVPLALTQTNARRICELAHHTHIPVYAGCPRPLLRPLLTAEDVHGKTGLDGITLPEPTMPLRSQHAVSFLIETLMRSQGEIVVAALGPLTNLAVALIQQPDICTKIQAIVVMGGAITHGNITPSAEFNFYVDPHAAHVVLSSGIPITLINLDLTHQAIATPERLAPIAQLNTPVGNAVINLLTHYSRHDMTTYGFAGAPLHDPCVIAYLLDPTLFTTRFVHIAVETQGEATIGRTIADFWQLTNQPPNVNLVDSINVDGFYQLLQRSLAAYSNY